MTLCGLLCFTEWALDFVSFFFFLCVISHIYFFLYIFDRTSRAYNEISQLVILFINHPVSDDFTVSLVTHKLMGCTQTDMLLLAYV